MFDKSMKDWNIDPDGRYAEDRKAGPVIEYKLSPEDLKKYETEPYKKPSMVGVEQMKQKEDCEDMNKVEKQKQARELIMKAIEEERNRKTRYYISTGWDNKVKAEQLAKVVEAAGGEITYKWWEHEYMDDTTELAKRGEAEIQGITNADVVIVMMPGKFGTHVELGAALALGKRILLYGPDGFETVPFYHIGCVKQVIGSELELVAEVLKEGLK